MLIEQIIEFDLRGPEPLCRTCTPKPGYFHDKTKISQANTWVIIYCQIIVGGNVPCFFHLGQLSHSQNLTPKFKILSMCVDLICK